MRFGKTLYLKFENWLTRVPVDTVIRHVDGAEKMEEGFVEPEVETEDEKRLRNYQRMLKKL